MAVIPVFISSTFQDFHAERDAIRATAVPILDEKLREYGASIQLLDLRWGVDTSALDEAAANDRVLGVCLREVERCRPLFVGLVGDRYGWIPSRERLRYVTDIAGVTDDLPGEWKEGLSITALEIWYGALHSTDQALVYFRHLKGATPSGWADGDRSRLDQLKNAIRRSAENGQLKLGSYDLDPAQEQTDAEAFALALADELWPMVRQRAEALQTAAETAYDSAARLRQERLSTVFVGRDDLVSKVSERLKFTPGMVLHGTPGCGKSAVLVAVQRQLVANGWQVASWVVGAAPGSDTSQGMIRPLAEQALGSRASVPFTGSLDDDENLLVWWERMVCNLPPHTAILYDDLDVLAPGRDHDLLPMLRAVISHPDTKFLVTTSDEAQAELLASWGMELAQVPDNLPVDDVLQSAQAWTATNGQRTLPAEVLDELARQPRSPWWIRVAVDELVDADATVFREAEQESATGVAPNVALAHSLTRLTADFPSTLDGMIARALDRACRAFAAPDQGHLFLALLALARSGLAPVTLENLLGSTPLEISRARWTLSNLVETGDAAGRLRFARPWIRQIVLAYVRSLGPLPQDEALHAMLARAIQPDSKDLTDRLDRLWHALYGSDAVTKAESLFNIPFGSQAIALLNRISLDRNDTSWISTWKDPAEQEMAQVAPRFPADLLPLVHVLAGMAGGSLPSFLLVWLDDMAAEPFWQAPGFDVISAMLEIVKVQRLARTIYSWPAVPGTSFAKQMSRLDEAEAVLTVRSPDHLLAHADPSVIEFWHQQLTAARVMLASIHDEQGEISDEQMLALEYSMRDLAGSFSSASETAAFSPKWSDIVNGLSAGRITPEGLQTLRTVADHYRASYLREPSRMNADMLRGILLELATAMALDGRDDEAVTIFREAYDVKLPIVEWEKTNSDPNLFFENWLAGASETTRLPVEDDVPEGELLSTELATLVASRFRLAHQTAGGKSWGAIHMRAPLAKAAQEISEKLLDVDAEKLFEQENEKLLDGGKMLNAGMGHCQDLGRIAANLDCGIAAATAWASWNAHPRPPRRFTINSATTPDDFKKMLLGTDQPYLEAIDPATTFNPEPRLALLCLGQDVDMLALQWFQEQDWSRFLATVEKGLADLFTLADGRLCIDEDDELHGIATVLHRFRATGYEILEGGSRFKRRAKTESARQAWHDLATAIQHRIDKGWPIDDDAQQLLRLARLRAG